jgi:hypothetical protein
MYAGTLFRRESRTGTAFRFTYNDAKNPALLPQRKEVWMNGWKWRVNSREKDTVRKKQIKKPGRKATLRFDGLFK